jgi:hypothetical protein
MSRHSNDLRKRVIAHYHKHKSKQTKTKKQICQDFSISRQTLDNWIELDREGDLFEIKQYHHGFSSRVDLAELKKYVDNNPDKYYSEIAKNFSVGAEQIRILITQKLGYTSKKNKQFTKKQIQTKKRSLKKK